MNWRDFFFPRRRLAELREEFELLKSCHDDHYQSYLAVMRELGEHIFALKTFCTVIEELGKARKASDCAASDLDYDGSGDDWKEYVEPLLMGSYEQAMALLGRDDVRPLG